MSRHLLVGEPHRPQGDTDGVLRHGAAVVPRRGEDVSPVSRQGPELRQEGDRLTAQGNRMRAALLHLLLGDLPDRPLEVDFAPLRPPHLAGSSQGVEAEPQGAAHDGRPLIGGHAQQEPLDVLHPGKRREVLRPLGGQSPPEGGGDIGLAGPRRDAVACHLPKNLLDAPRRLHAPALLDRPQDGQQLGSLDLVKRTLPQGRKQECLQPIPHRLGMARSPNRLDVLPKPFQGYIRKRGLLGRIEGLMRGYPPGLGLPQFVALGPRLAQGHGGILPRVSFRRAPSSE